MLFIVKKTTGTQPCVLEVCSNCRLSLPILIYIETERGRINLIDKFIQPVCWALQTELTLGAYI